MVGKDILLEQDTKKALRIKEKTDELDIKLWTSVHQKIQVGKWKSKHMAEKISQHT